MFAIFVVAAWVLVIMLVICLLMMGVLGFVFWIWMLIDSIKNESIGSNEKVAWVLAIVFTHWLGALIYFFAGRPRRKLPTVAASA